MLEKRTVREIIEESSEKYKVEYIEREDLKQAEKYLKFKEVLAISGVRRSGKTYLMYQLINRLIISKISRKNILYINFEDERLVFIEAKDLAQIYETFIEINNPKGKIYFFLDEIQNIPFWEKWIARMYEKNIKFVISGSNASLLSSEFSTALTGRNIVFNLFPFSFREFIYSKDEKLLKDVKKSEFISEKRAKFKRLLREYMKIGGFPEVLLNNKPELLNNYFNDIIFRDIIKRYNIKYKDSLEKIALYLIANISAHTSFYKLKKIIEARGINTIKNYVSYFEKAFLLFHTSMFSFSMKQQIYNPFKVYCIDSGLRNIISFKFSEDIGRIAENLVFIELKRRSKEIFYWKNKNEVDFLIKEGLKPKNLIQVCWDISDEKTKQREINGLLEAMKKFRLRKGLIITEDYSGEEKMDRKTIKYVPLWRWLLN